MNGSKIKYLDSDLEITLLYVLAAFLKPNNGMYAECETKYTNFVYSNDTSNYIRYLKNMNVIKKNYINKIVA